MAARAGADEIGKGCINGHMEAVSLLHPSENRPRIHDGYPAWVYLEPATEPKVGYCGNVAQSIDSKRLSRYNRRMTYLATVILLLTTCFTAVAQKLPQVALLSTGGTIASKQDPAKGGYLPALSGEDLVSAVPAIKKIAQIQVEQISNIPSPDITPEIWVRLAGSVNELLTKTEITRIVVTHGTDTLEETAYFLDLTT